MNSPLPPPPIWTTGSTEVFRTGTWRAAIARHVKAPSPCHQACPVNGEIADWIGRARAGDWRGAWELLTLHNPFPAIAGRICHHPCETACNRATFDSAVSICKLERFAGDTAIEQGWAFDAPKQERSGHVAIVGGGPAGLSAAFQLRRRGWRVTIHEASDALGGLMRHGIPAYRLARDVLDAEVRRIVALGVDVELGAKLDTPEALDQLRATHDAVFVAVGAARVKRLPVLDYSAPWALDGAAYLAACNAGTAPALGRSVIVVGGGSAALDAARSARRNGHEVTIVALESRAAMPAQKDEVEEALEEGIALLDAAALTRVEATPTGLRLHARRVRPDFQPVPGSDFEFAADAVLSSIGQDPDLAPFAGRIAARGALLAADRDGRTSADKVWAGGDVASMARFVTEAVGMGERAALAIHRALSGEDVSRPDEPQPVALKQIATWYHTTAPRAQDARRLPSERRTSTLEVQLGLEIEQALAEGERCFSCGTCIECDNCVVVCPDLALRRADGGGYEVLTDYCKGCGLCVRECPTGSMEMVEEAR